jgi:MscS family membrane protein
LPERFNSFINDVFKSGIIVLSASAVYALIGYYTASERKNHRIFNHEVDKILLPFFSKVVRIVVLALAFVAIASKWGYDVNGFIAGLGLGGLAFALAAKDLLANVFSGIVIITDKPYSIGDWIKTSEFEGTIENINFRSTRIRAFDQALVIVPNFNLINAPIINFTRRSIRRITFQIGVTYTTPADKLKKCITEMEEVLRNHPDIDQQTIVVKFDSFGNGALQLLLCFFAKTIVWEEYLDIKQDINLKIMGVLETQGVSLAFPSTSVYLETPVQFHKQE